MRTRGFFALAAVLLLFVTAGCLGGALPFGSHDRGTAVVWQSHTGEANGTLTYRSSGAARLQGETFVVAPLGSNTHDCSLVAMNATGGVRWRHNVSDEGGVCRAQDIATPHVTSLGGRPVVAVTMKKSLYLFDAKTGAVRFRKRLSPMAFTEPVVVHGPHPLVVTAMMKGGVYAFHPNGSLAWHHQLGSIATGERPQVVHPASGGPPLVVVGGSQTTAAFAPNGSVAWRRNVSARFLQSGRVHGRDVLVAASEYHVTALYANGTNAWTRHTNQSMTVGAVASPTPGAAPLAYVTADNGSVAALYAANGTTAWRRSLQDYRRFVPPPAVGALAGGARRQVVVGIVDGRVRVLDAGNGTVLGTYDRDAGLWTRPTVVDVNGDGRDEVALTYEDGHVVVLRYTGD